MPLNGSGTASQPVGGVYPAVASTLIESGKFNISIADIYTILSSAIYKDGQATTTQRIPFAQGISTDTVTEKTSAAGVTVDGVLLKDGRVDSAKGSDITAATTINLETATGNLVDITGNTQIDAVTLSEGHWRLARFTGTPQLTHGASLVLQGGVNITAAAGDYALFLGYGSSVVRAIYFPVAAASQLRVSDPGADRLLFWDDSAGANAHLAVSGMTITDTTVAVNTASDTGAGSVELATNAETLSGSSSTLAVTPAGLKSQRGLVLLNSGQVTNEATLDVVMTSYTAFKNKLLVIENFVPQTDTANLSGYVSTDGGSNYDSGAGAYGYATSLMSQSGSRSDAGGTDSQIAIATSCGTGTGETVCAKIWMYATETATYGKFHVEASYYDSSPNTIIRDASYTRLAAQNTDAFRLSFSSGNIASGTWALYGFHE